MKKSFTLLFSLAIVLATFAQSTITRTSYDYSFGEDYDMSTVDAETFGAISEGANMTWDYSGLVSTNTFTSYIVSPTSSPNNSSFSPATYCGYDGDATYSYIYVDNSIYEMIGIDRTGTIMAYSDPERLMQFPFTYNTTFSDDFVVDFLSNGVDFHREGTVTVTGVGYGSVTTPAGSFTDVLLIKTVEVYSDEYEMMEGFPQTINYTSNIYHWIKPNVQGALLTYSESITDFGDAKSAMYLVSPNVRIKEINKLKVDMYPNPTKDFVTIKTESNINSVSISNSLGQVVLKQNFYLNEFKINILDLESGIYFVNIQGKEESSISKLIKE